MQLLRVPLTDGGRSWTCGWRVSRWTRPNPRNRRNKSTSRRKRKVVLWLLARVLEVEVLSFSCRLFDFWVCTGIFSCGVLIGNMPKAIGGSNEGGALGKMTQKIGWRPPLGKFWIRRWSSNLLYLISTVGVLQQEMYWRKNKPNSMKKEWDLTRSSSSLGFLPKYKDIRRNLPRTLYSLGLFRIIHGHSVKSHQIMK